jgi:hypothetical protein
MCITATGVATNHDCKEQYIMSLNLFKLAHKRNQRVNHNPHLTSAPGSPAPAPTTARAPSAGADRALLKRPAPRLTLRAMQTPIRSEKFIVWAVIGAGRHDNDDPGRVTAAAITKRGFLTALNRCGRCGGT